MDALQKIIRGCIAETLTDFPAARATALTRLVRAAVYWRSRSLPSPPSRQTIAEAVNAEIAKLEQDYFDQT